MRSRPVKGGTAGVCDDAPSLLPALLDELRDKSGPSCLMAGPYPGPIVTMEVLIKRDGIPPGRIVLEFPDPAAHRTPAGLITEENMRQSPGELGGDFVQRDESP